MRVHKHMPSHRWPCFMHRRIYQYKTEFTKCFMMTFKAHNRGMCTKHKTCALFLFFKYLILKEWGWGHLNFNSIIVKNGKSTFKSSVMPSAWSSIPIFILIDSQESPLCPLTNLVEQFALTIDAAVNCLFLQDRQNVRPGLNPTCLTLW